ncbi:glycosyl hydrolase family 5 [Paludisphaera rhizosphaerae]|uniref:glycosyl hydrolase family 5 n=1 Tax=Paludisphaera rhizosphaerae TaxID=2711216 RepID=UPI0013EB84D2|nr:glycosyl hydrolase family 5 [Paludisphaera rhizosphaerae]
MKPRSSPAAAVVLCLLWSLSCTTAAPAANAIEGKDWTWRIQADGTVRVSCKGTPVLESGHIAWGKAWAWAGVSAEYHAEGEGNGTFKGGVSDLGTEMTGQYRSPRPNVLTMDLRMASARSIAEAIGAGQNWTLRLDSPVFGGRAAMPELAAGGQGWTWRPAPGMEIRLTVEPGAAKVYYENGVRIFFLADRVDRGEKRFRLTLTLPEGATRESSPEERYDPEAKARWFAGALDWNASPVDLRFLNAGDRPAGGRGPVRASGDALVFGDGSPARFWGGNLAAYALFATPRATVPAQARRMAQMGFNLMRIHHHDSSWVSPNVFGRKPTTTRRLDPAAMERLDWWIKSLKDEGIYVWLDLRVGRQIPPGDGPPNGADEIARSEGSLIGYDYLNDGVRALMREFQDAYLSHVNPHTGLAYKDDPGVAAVLVTNEDDLTTHFAGLFGPGSGRPFHEGLLTREARSFAARTGLPEAQTLAVGSPGADKMLLADLEHRFNEEMIADLRRLGFRSPVATTNTWGDAGLANLAALADGDVIDVHAYGEAEWLGSNPRTDASFAAWIGAGQVSGKPTTISEWNVPFPAVDRFAAPLYVAALSAFQGWDAPMIYNYSQDPLQTPSGPSTWSSFSDPALAGVMPAAALLFRRGQVAPARGTIHLALSPEHFFGGVSAKSSAAIRTAVEQSRLTIGVPETPHLPWLKPSPVPEGATVIQDPDRDLIPEGRMSVRSDTGELTRDWQRGVHVIDAPKCQAASGWIGGDPIVTTDARFEVLTKKAVVALNSVDDQPLSQSKFILITTVARAVADPEKRSAYISEPVVATITLKTAATDLELLALASDGRIAGRLQPKHADGAVRIELPAARGSHWYVLRAPGAKPGP